MYGGISTMATLTRPKQRPLRCYLLLLAVLSSLLLTVGGYHLISRDLEERTLETVTPVVIALDEEPPNPTASPRLSTPTQTHSAQRYLTATPTLTRPFPKPTDTALSPPEFNSGKEVTTTPTATSTTSAGRTAAGRRLPRGCGLDCRAADSGPAATNRKSLPNSHQYDTTGL